MDNPLLASVSSTTEIADFRKGIRQEYGSVVTNYSVFPAEAQKWIESGKLKAVRVGKSQFLVHMAPRVEEIYFFSPSYECMSEDVRAFPEISSEKPCVMEIIRKDEAEIEGLEPLMVLNRMSSTQIPLFNAEKANRCEPAREEDVRNIERILLNNFNPVAERIPTFGDLAEMIANPEGSGVFIIKERERIIGVMICSLDPSTIHLRYWWTDPEYRGSGVGSSLLNRFFELASVRKRMILWVSRSNANAIEKYRHYGFESEAMYDYIYQLK